MNLKILPSRSIKTLHGSIAEWAVIVRFLVALKSNQDYGLPCESISEWSDDKHKTPGSCTGTKVSRHFAPGWMTWEYGLLLSTWVYLFLTASTAWAHGGMAVQIDSCRILVGNQWVHFTAYTPELTADEEFCKALPEIGRTNLVFDYEGRTLRNLNVAFEVTKEPDGAAIYYQEPANHNTGTLNAVVDFNQFGAGDYLVHVTLISEGEKIDAHLPFTVGTRGFLLMPYYINVLLAVIGLTVAGLLIRSFRKRLSGFMDSRKRRAA